MTTGSREPESGAVWNSPPFLFLFLLSLFSQSVHADYYLILLFVYRCRVKLVVVVVGRGSAGSLLKSRSMNRLVIDSVELRRPKFIRSHTCVQAESLFNY